MPQKEAGCAVPYRQMTRAPWWRGKVTLAPQPAHMIRATTGNPHGQSNHRPPTWSEQPQATHMVRATTGNPYDQSNHRQPT